MFVLRLRRTNNDDDDVERETKAGVPLAALELKKNGEVVAALEIHKAKEPLLNRIVRLRPKSDLATRRQHKRLCSSYLELCLRCAPTVNGGVREVFYVTLVFGYTFTIRSLTLTA